VVGGNDGWQVATKSVKWQQRALSGKKDSEFLFSGSNRTGN